MQTNPLALIQQQQLASGQKVDTKASKSKFNISNENLLRSQREHKYIRVGLPTIGFTSLASASKFFQATGEATFSSGAYVEKVEGQKKKKAYGKGPDFVFLNGVLGSRDLNQVKAIKIAGKWAHVKQFLTMHNPFGNLTPEQAAEFMSMNAYGIHTLYSGENRTKLFASAADMARDNRTAIKVMIDDFSTGNNNQLSLQNHERLLQRYHAEIKEIEAAKQDLKQKSKDFDIVLYIDLAPYINKGGDSIRAVDKEGNLVKPIKGAKGSAKTIHEKLASFLLSDKRETHYFDITKYPVTGKNKRQTGQKKSKKVYITFNFQYQDQAGNQRNERLSNDVATSSTDKNQIAEALKALGVQPAEADNTAIQVVHRVVQQAKKKEKAQSSFIDLGPTAKASEDFQKQIINFAQQPVTQEQNISIDLPPQ